MNATPQQITVGLRGIILHVDDEDNSLEVRFKHDDLPETQWVSEEDRAKLKTDVEVQISPTENYLSHELSRWSFVQSGMCCGLMPLSMENCLIRTCYCQCATSTDVLTTDGNRGVRHSIAGERGIGSDFEETLKNFQELPDFEELLAEDCQVLYADDTNTTVADDHVHLGSLSTGATQQYPRHSVAVSLVDDSTHQSSLSTGHTQQYPRHSVAVSMSDNASLLQAHSGQGITARGENSAQHGTGLNDVVELAERCTNWSDLAGLESEGASCSSQNVSENVSEDASQTDSESTTPAFRPQCTLFSESAAFPNSRTVSDPRGLSVLYADDPIPLEKMVEKNQSDPSGLKLRDA